MSSSVKYKRFAISEGDDEKKSHESRKKSKFLAFVLVFVAIASVTISVTAVAIGVGVGVSTESGHSVDANGLTVTVITREQLQGEYLGSAGGIHFQTTVNSSHVSLFVTTESGEPVVNILHHVNLSMTMMTAKNATFLVMESRPGHKRYVDYVIPKTLTNHMQSIMVGQGNMSDEILQWLDNKTVAQTRQSSLENLTFSQEALLIIEAAKVLGNHGVYGSEYPAAMSFYQLALKLAKAREAEASNFTLNSKVTKELRQKRGVMCSNVNAVCEQCPFQHDNNDCFGLCGYGCDCWNFVCGDCCVHQFCLTHDRCCAERGFYSWACLSVTWRQVAYASCSQSYDC